jgi:hypothetical protein
MLLEQLILAVVEVEAVEVALLMVVEQAVQES